MMGGDRFLREYPTNERQLGPGEPRQFRGPFFPAAWKTRPKLTEIKPTATDTVATTATARATVTRQLNQHVVSRTD